MTRVTAEVLPYSETLGSRVRLVADDTTLATVCQLVVLGVTPASDAPDGHRDASEPLAQAIAARLDGMMIETP